MTELFWESAQHHHRLELQRFRCAEHPYRRLKKLNRLYGHDRGSWQSLVQGHIRNLKPPYEAPRYLRLGRRVEASELGAVYYFEKQSRNPEATLYIYLGLLGTARAHRRRGLGRSALGEFFREAGALGRDGKFTELIVSCVVHRKNQACRGLLASTGWTEMGPDEYQAGCTKWSIRGTAA